MVLDFLDHLVPAGAGGEGQVTPQRRHDRRVVASRAVFQSVQEGLGGRGQGTRAIALGGNGLGLEDSFEQLRRTFARQAAGREFRLDPLVPQQLGEQEGAVEGISRPRQVGPLRPAQDAGIGFVTDAVADIAERRLDACL